MKAHPTTRAAHSVSSSHFVSIARFTCHLLHCAEDVEIMSRVMRKFDQLNLHWLYTEDDEIMSHMRKFGQLTFSFTTCTVLTQRTWRSCRA